MNVLLALISLIFILSSTTTLFAEVTPLKGAFNQEVELHHCTEKELGIQFLCNPNWSIETDKNAILVVISEGPAVTLTIARSDSPVIFLEQLTPDVLQEMGQYADGFETEKVEIAGEEAIKVEGAAIKYPEMRLMDFYLLHDLNVFSFLFLVNPKEQWSAYEDLINTILNSIQFIDKEKIEIKSE